MTWKFSLIIECRKFLNQILTTSKENTSFTSFHQKRNLLKAFIFTVLYSVHSVIFVHFSENVKGALLRYIIWKMCVWVILYINFIDNILSFLANQTQEKSNAINDLLKTRKVSVDFFHMPPMTQSLRQARSENLSNNVFSSDFFLSHFVMKHRQSRWL